MTSFESLLAKYYVRLLAKDLFVEKIWRSRNFELGVPWCIFSMIHKSLPGIFICSLTKMYFKQKLQIDCVHWTQSISWASTLESGINVGVRLWVFEKKKIKKKNPSKLSPKLSKNLFINLVSIYIRVAKTGSLGPCKGQ